MSDAPQNMRHGRPKQRSLSRRKYHTSVKATATRTVMASVIGYTQAPGPARGGALLNRARDGAQATPGGSVTTTANATPVVAISPNIAAASAGVAMAEK